jgi:hypothetical protein
VRVGILPSFVCALIATGCATDTNLVPAPGANLVPGLEGGAMSREAGVQAEVRPNVWPGEAPISEEVTPVRVTIDNNSDVPIRVRYADFELQAPGRTYRALPPMRITGSVSEPAVVSPYGPFADPGFGAVGFGVTPAYSTFYPGYPVAADPFVYDPLWYSTGYDRWREYELPTERMVALAVPEGTVQPGGELTGFLYFEEVPGDVPDALFTMELVNARTGEPIDTIEIPFRVVEA